MSEEVEKFVKDMSVDDQNKIITAIETCFMKTNVKVDVTSSKNKEGEDNKFERIQELIKIGTKINETSIKVLEAKKPSKPFQPVDLERIDIKCL